MKIVVLIKEVPDPEGIYTLDGDGNVLSDELPRLLSVFDENAIEAAVQIKESQGDVTVTLLSHGQPSCDKSLTHGLAMGADEAVLVEDGEAGARGSYAVAGALAAGIRKLGGADLIIAGRESSDAGAGLVGPLVARLLGMPFLTLVVKIELADGGLRLTRLAEAGYDLFAATPPVLLTVSNQINFPRYPSVIKFLQAKKKPLWRWPVADLGVDLAPPEDGRVRLLRRYQPVVMGNCHFAEGDTPEAKVQDLARLLKSC